MRRMFAVLLCVFFLSPVTVRASEEKYVALTFDDGPSGKYTQRLLDGLSERGAKATFLLCGYRMKEYPNLTVRLVEEGHEIGIHGYSHDNMKPMTRRQIAQEIMDTEDLLPEGCKVRFLRPPGGGCSDGVRQVARARDLAVLDWSVDPRDWATSDASAIHTAVIDRVRDGDVVLLHDMSDSSVDAALRIVDQLQEKGFTFVTVSQLAKLRDVDIQPGKVYKSFPKQEEPPK